jgi:hypothetical protein
MITCARGFGVCDELFCSHKHQNLMKNLPQMITPIVVANYLIPIIHFINFNLPLV